MAFVCYTTFIRYTKCPKCGKVAELRTTTIRTKLSDIEIKQRETVKKMVEDLLGKDAPPIKFPATSRPEVNCHHCNFQEKIWGWTSQLGKGFAIFYPRQSFFLPRDEFADTVAHEPAHFLINVIGEEVVKHGKKWYFQYRRNREMLFKKYQKFINSSESLPIKYRKSYGNLCSSRFKKEYDEKTPTKIERKKKVSKK